MAKTKKQDSAVSLNLNITNKDVKKYKNFLAKEFYSPLPDDKSYSIYILLAVLLSAFQVHLFYARKTKLAIAMLVSMFIAGLVPILFAVWLAVYLFYIVGMFVALYQFEKETRLKLKK